MVVYKGRGERTLVGRAFYIETLIHNDSIPTIVNELLSILFNTNTLISTELQLTIYKIVLLMLNFKKPRSNTGRTTNKGEDIVF